VHPGDVPRLIRELAQLRDDGILSDAEFTTKKAELLSRL
jgi:Short C-terminal domain